MAKHIEVIARGLIPGARGILLCRNVKGGYSYLPGGRGEFGEPAREALRRELLEEAALAIRPTTLALVTEGRFEEQGVHHEVNLVFHVELKGGPNEVLSREENIEFHWAPWESLEELDLRPASIREFTASSKHMLDRVAEEGLQFLSME
jgi:ADP-ribose pyrophosphatase YjhB (NUDIX family)